MRVAIAETAGLAPGEVTVGQLVTGLRQLGFDYVWGAKTPGMPKRPHGVHFVALDRISQVVDNLF